MKDTLSFLVQSLLQKNKIKNDSDELDFQIQSRPSYLSLHAITRELSYSDIENAAIGYRNVHIIEFQEVL